MDLIEKPACAADCQETDYVEVMDIPHSCHFQAQFIHQELMDQGVCFKNAKSIIEKYKITQEMNQETDQGTPHEASNDNCTTWI